MRKVVVVFEIDEFDISKTYFDDINLDHPDTFDNSATTISIQPSILGTRALVLLKGAKSARVVDVQVVDEIKKLIHHPGQMTIESYENVADHVGKEVMGNG